jgi:hypothetical protein
MFNLYIHFNFLYVDYVQMALCNHTSIHGYLINKKIYGAGSVPSPLSTPSRIIHPEKGGAPVAAPLYKTPKPLPAKIHSPVLTPSVSNYKHHHKRNIITVPAPAPSYIVSPPISNPRGLPHYMNNLLNCVTNEVLYCN